MPLKTLIDGLCYAEGLRWHQGRLWLSDFITRRVFSVDEHGQVTEQAYVPGQPSGLGFTLDGRPLVVSMLDRRLVSIVNGQMALLANLGHLAASPCNDMVVDPEGNAYIGCMGYQLYFEKPAPETRSPLIRVSPGGLARIAAEDLRGPNGMVFLPGERQLVVAETHACCLTAFTVEADGTLSNRRLFADLGEIHPDGICVDRNGDVWVAGLYGEQFILVRDGGQVLRIIPTPGRWAVSCALGGQEGNRLFLATALLSRPNDFRNGKTRSTIHYTDVDCGAL